MDLEKYTASLSANIKAKMHTEFPRITDVDVVFASNPSEFGNLLTVTTRTKMPLPQDGHRFFKTAIPDTQIPSDRRVREGASIAYQIEWYANEVCNRYRAAQVPISDYGRATGPMLDEPVVVKPPMPFRTEAEITIQALHKRVDELVAERDEAKDSAKFWGRASGRLSADKTKLNEEIDVLRMKVAECSRVAEQYQQNGERLAEEVRGRNERIGTLEADKQALRDKCARYAKPPASQPSHCLSCEQYSVLVETLRDDLAQARTDLDAWRDAETRMSADSGASPLEWKVIADRRAARLTAFKNDQTRQCAACMERRRQAGDITGLGAGMVRLANGKVVDANTLHSDVLRLAKLVDEGNADSIRGVEATANLRKWLEDERAKNRVLRVSRDALQTRYSALRKERWEGMGKPQKLTKADQAAREQRHAREDAQKQEATGPVGQTPAEWAKYRLAPSADHVWGKCPRCGGTHWVRTVK